MWLLRTCTCPRLNKQPDRYPTSAHQARGSCFHEGFEVYSSTPRLLPQPFNVGFLQFSSASQLGASKRNVRSKILGLCSERESQVLRSFLLLPQCVFKVSFQEFLASPAVMRLVKSQLSLAWVVRNRSRLAIFLQLCRYDFIDLSCLVLQSCLSDVLVECKDLFSNQAEKEFLKELTINTHTHKC